MLQAGQREWGDWNAPHLPSGAEDVKLLGGLNFCILLRVAKVL